MAPRNTPSTAEADTSSAGQAGNLETRAKATIAATVELPGTVVAAASGKALDGLDTILRLLRESPKVVEEVGGQVKGDSGRIIDQVISIAEEVKGHVQHLNDQATPKQP